jgi:hypothetical protein
VVNSDVSEISTAYRYASRERFVRHPEQFYFVTIEFDNNVLCLVQQFSQNYLRSIDPADVMLGKAVAQNPTHMRQTDVKLSPNTSRTSVEGLRQKAYYLLAMVIANVTAAIETEISTVCTVADVRTHKSVKEAKGKRQGKSSIVVELIREHMWLRYPMVTRNPNPQTEFSANLNGSFNRSPPNATMAFIPYGSNEYQTYGQNPLPGYSNGQFLYPGTLSHFSTL